MRTPRLLAAGFPVAGALGIALLLLAGCAGGSPGETQERELKVADVELASGMPEAALQLMQQAAAQRPDDAAALVRLGEANMALGRWEAAETSFRRAVSNNPGSMEAALGLARLHLVTDPPAALVDLRGLAARWPRDPRLLTDLGVASDLVGQPTAAQAAYRQAIALDPGNLSAQVDLGLSLALSGHPQQAMAILAPLARSADASPRIRQDYAIAATLSGQSNAAQLALGGMPKEQVAAALSAYSAFRVTPH